ncbi:MBL fold metallo-hydrolase [Aliiglaciecola litoralis]|uniref:MBL fold metallo-hydrolase n=1 Tax=Aliiglaciecola litoralis TaxID=582857 RepID=A0ABN1LQ66_9ALTE
MSDVSFTVLGCGHSESLEHFNNNAMIRSTNHTMLIDCGHTIKHALAAQKLTFADIDSVFITHVHGDHVFGLERLAYESKFKYNKKVTLYLHEEIKHELWDQTLAGSLGRDSDGINSMDDWFDVKFVENDTICIDKLRINTFEVAHTPSKTTHGILLNNRLFYSSDTTSIADVITDLQFDIGFHDVTLTDWNPVHATLDSLIQDYPESVRRKLFLMSYEDNWQAHLEKVEKYFKGFAYQGQTINL